MVFLLKMVAISNKNNFSLNCSYSSNDLKKNVYNNRKLVCNYHKLDIQNLKIVNQVHSNKILVVNNTKQITSKIDADAMITNKPNIVLGILTADCAPVLAFDPIRNIIAAIHIGWKGAIKNILSNTIDSFIGMKSEIKNIRLAIGPCIGPESYEVQKDFYKKFTKKIL
jgi:YfiH family protein